MLFAASATTSPLSTFVCRSDRDVNPTPEATVQKFYNAHESHDLAIQMKKKGNTVSALKSATPRFQGICETKGPGAYSPEKVSTWYLGLLSELCQCFLL